MKKITALFIVVVLFISLFAVSFLVSADETVMTNQEYYAAQSYLIAKYKDGKISYSEFQQQSQAVTDEFVTNNTVGGVLQSGALNASNTFNAVAQKIGNTVQKYGDNARYYIDDYVSNFFDSYTKLNYNPTFDLQGRGAGYRIPFANSGTKVDGYEIWLCDYVEIVPYGDGTYYYRFHNVHCDVYRLSGAFWFTKGDSNVLSADPKDGEKRYGDWRWASDGTQFETDDEFEIISDYDFSEAPEMELEDLLKKILNEMELKEPDLSTIEGLLNAIYARLGTLDSDNDNELLASVNSAILALVKSNDDNNKALLEELLKFREALKNDTIGTDTNSHGHEISGTIYNVIPLDKNWLNKIFHDKENLKVQYEGKTYYLEDCGCLKLDDKFYSVDMNYDSYALSDYDFSNADIEIDNKYVNVDFNNYTALFASFSSSQKKKLNNVIDLIYKMVTQAVPYGAIASAFAPFEVIIFNTAEPKDIVFEFKATGDFSGFSATILAVSFFQNPYVSQAMEIVKPLLTVFIGYFWLKAMRKKAVSMLG